MSEDDVIALYADYKTGLSCAQVGRNNGWSGSYVSQLFRDRKWPLRQPGEQYGDFPPTDVRRIKDPDRFWSKVSPQGDGSYEDCWLWAGSKNKSGYGAFAVGGKESGMSCAHRVAYELMVSEIPKGLQIDHLCRTPACVNPWHMEPVTPKVNSHRSRSVAVNRARMLAITHCPQGHEYTPENIQVKHLSNGNKGRGCRACARAYASRKRAEARAAS